MRGTQARCASTNVRIFLMFADTSDRVTASDANVFPRARRFIGESMFSFAESSTVEGLPLWALTAPSPDLIEIQI